MRRTVVAQRSRLRSSRWPPWRVQCTTISRAAAMGSNEQASSIVPDDHPARAGELIVELTTQDVEEDFDRPCMVRIVMSIMLETLPVEKERILAFLQGR